MPTKLIGSQSNNQPKRKVTRAKDSVMKPLAKAYVRENPNLEGEAFPIYSGKVTAKGFLLLNCEDFTVLFPAGIEIGSILLDDILPQLNGKKANQLVAVLNNDNRFGADIGTNDDCQVYYRFDSEDESFLTSNEPITREKQERKKLSLADFGLDTESKTSSPTKPLDAPSLDGGVKEKRTPTNK